MHHSTVRKALASLAHPLSLAAITLLLVNDLILRTLWPSWWTGKLGDLAWMVFAPFVLAVVLGWLIPQCGSAQRHEHITFWMAFGLAGLGFATVKTLPVFNELTVTAFSQIAGFAPALRYDPSDLLALPGLLVGLWIWNNSQSVSLQNRWRVLNRRVSSLQPAFSRRHLAGLAFAALALMADMAAEDMGIACMWSEGNTIYAASYFYTFSSHDGGVTWEQVAVGPSHGCYSETVAQASIASEAGVVAGQPIQDYDETQYPWGGEVVPGPRDGQLFRFFTNREIQRSTDHGQHWETVYSVIPEPQAQFYYYRKLNGEGVTIRSWKPQDAAFDPVTGNVLFAMGIDGVLVRTPQEQWVWSALGKYQRVGSFPTLDALVLLLFGMVLMALALPVLLFALLTMRKKMSLGQYVCTGLGWAIWVATATHPPATWYHSDPSLGKIAPGLGFLEPLLVFAVVLLCLGLMKWVVYDNIRLALRDSVDNLRLLIACFLSGLLYFVPYVLWAYNLLPQIDSAVILSLILAVIPVLIEGGRQQFRRQFPSL